MFKNRIIPCLLLDGEVLTKTIKFSSHKYIGDPINSVKIFNDKGADELIFIDIEVSKKNIPIKYNILYKIANQSFMPLGYGGGIRKIEDAKKIFQMGFEKISINSYALENEDFVKRLCSIFGSQSIVVTIDVKKNILGKYFVYNHATNKMCKIEPVHYAKKLEKIGVGELIINSVDKDGTMKGYDLEIISDISSVVNIPVIALGGAGSIKDMKNAIDVGASAASAGSLFVFYGPHRAVLINYPDHKEICRVFQ